MYGDTGVVKTDLPHGARTREESVTAVGSDVMAPETDFPNYESKHNLRIRQVSYARFCPGVP